jgi:hypothetical protein
MINPLQIPAQSPLNLFFHAHTHAKCPTDGGALSISRAGRTPGCEAGSQPANLLSARNYRGVKANPFRSPHSYSATS